MALPAVTRAQMLLSTTYKLDVIFKNQVIVGIQLQNDENFAPLVVLESLRSGVHICIAADEWEWFYQQLCYITTYFLAKEEGSEPCNSFKTINVRSFHVHFTTSRGIPTVKFERRQMGQRRRCITMRKYAFETLKNYSRCITLQLDKLKSMPVNHYMHAAVGCASRIIWREVLRGYSPEVLPLTTITECIYDYAERVAYEVGKEVHSNKAAGYDVAILITEMIVVHMQTISENVKRSLDTLKFTS